VRPPQAVDAHSDQKDDEVAVDLRGLSAGDDGHEVTPLRRHGVGITAPDPMDWIDNGDWPSPPIG
jgi:hypothetical protein